MDSPGVRGAAADGIDIAAYLAVEREKANRALDRAVAIMAERLGDLATEDVAGSVRHGVSGGGKRIRPLLCVAAYRAAGGQASDPAIHDYAATIEMVHASSLMHDDLPCMDDAVLRRGTAVTHLVHGEAATMRAGAILIPAALVLALESARVLECGEDGARASVLALAHAYGAAGMVGGQWLDLVGEDRELDLAALDDLHRRKTGALLGVSPEMGARAAGAPVATVKALRAYGHALGLAFQIVDDILDATGDASTLGKEPSDQALGKSTYVSHWGVDSARDMARVEMDRATAALDDAGLDSPALRAIAQHVVNRRR